MTTFEITLDGKTYSIEAYSLREAKTAALILSMNLYELPFEL
jgi:hypothetical protein